MEFNLTGELSGYSTSDNYVAQKFEQGGRTKYVIVLPLPLVVTTMPIPDPAAPFDDNREVNLGHAKSFAEYIRTQAKWHAGCLTVRTQQGATEFIPFQNGAIGSLEFGMLKVPRNSRLAFKIIDGQHRILGLKILMDSLANDLGVSKSNLAKAKRNSAEPAVIEQFEREVKSIEKVQQRIETDAIAIELVVEDDVELAKQIFVDVANNALGVRKAITSSFDQTKVVNRALNELLSNPSTDQLILNRVDIQKDRVVGSNLNLLGAGSLADIIRILEVGIVGRISRAQEKTLNDKTLAGQANRFFAVLRQAFPEVDSVANGNSMPADLRKSSLLGSTTMLKIMAGVFFELSGQGIAISEISKFFGKLSVHTAIPVVSTNPSGRMWINATTEGSIAEDSNAPGSRTQAVKSLVVAMTNWYANPPSELTGE